MKKYFLGLLFFVAAINLYGQEKEEEFKTLFSKIEANGGYGAFAINYSELSIAKNNIQSAAVIGGKGLWVANHYFGLGMGGYGIATASYFNELISKKVMFSAGYGGIIAEAIIFPKKVVHLTIPVLIGGGAATLMDSYMEHKNYDNSYNNYSLDQDQFFIIEPGLEMELNIVKYFRVSLGGYYRMTTGVNIIGVNRNVLDGFSGGMTFKFGCF